MNVILSMGLRNRIAAATQDVDHLFPNRSVRLNTYQAIWELIGETPKVESEHDLRIIVGDAIMLYGLNYQDAIVEYVVERILDYLTEPNH